MTKSLVLAVAFVVAGLAARQAAAAVCVQVDASRDNLPEADRNGLKILLEQTLAQHGQQVSNQGCTATYVVSHVRIGSAVTVFLQGPQGFRQASARILDDVPSLYSQMVRSLLTGQPMSTGNDTIDRNNVTSAQMAPNRAEADSLWYVRLGYAGVFGPTVTNGPAIGFGYRYELDTLGIDFSFLNLTWDSTDDSSGNTRSVGTSGSWLKLMALYFANPVSNGSFYLGGGLAWGLTASIDDTRAYSGSGLQGEVSAGFEFLRASTIRMFVQADGSLPFYTVKSSTYGPVTGTTIQTSSSWAPTVALSFGIGWGKSTTRVRVIQ